MTIDKATKHDLQWFVSCAHKVSGNVLIYKSASPCLHIAVYGSLNGLGGHFINRDYRLPTVGRRGRSIVHWEAINILVALKTRAKGSLSSAIPGLQSIYSGRGRDPVLHTVARNIWLFQASYNFEIKYRHFQGKRNQVADLLSRWTSHINLVAEILSLLNQPPIWDSPLPHAPKLNYSS
jgi:hypothetical protein